MAWNREDFFEKGFKTILCLVLEFNGFNTFSS